MLASHLESKGGVIVAHQGEKITIYLRQEDEFIRSKIEADRVGGLSASAVVRQALYNYYDPPTPKTDPILISMMKAIASLADSLQRQAEEIEAINKLLTDLCDGDDHALALEKQINKMKDYLFKAVYDRTARAEIKAALESNQNL